MEPALAQVLERSRALGFLGPGPIESHIEHSSLFGRALGSAECRYADIGAGGGVPSLPVLLTGPRLSAVLIDSSQKRCAFLVWAIAELGMTERADVWCGRAEEIGREDRARGQFDAVVARGFGPPAITLECATPLVCDGGRIVISEPPEPRLWPAEGLAGLGLTKLQAGRGVAVFRRDGALPDSVPRSTRQLKRAPLFEVG